MHLFVFISLHTITQDRLAVVKLWQEALKLRFIWVSKCVGTTLTVLQSIIILLYNKGLATLSLKLAKFAENGDFLLAREDNLRKRSRTACRAFSQNNSRLLCCDWLLTTVSESTFSFHCSWTTPQVLEVIVVVNNYYYYYYFINILLFSSSFAALLQHVDRMAGSVNWRSKKSPMFVG